MPAEVRLLADVDEAYGQMSGLAARKLHPKFPEELDLPTWDARRATSPIPNALSATWTRSAPSTVSETLVGETPTREPASAG